MSNNVYTSPRVYLSKSRSKQKIKTQAHFEMGIGYVLPEGVSKADFKKEYSKWEQKLQNSGFIDIEYRSPSQSGYFTPFFRENGSTATFQALYDPAKEEYFSFTREFANYMCQRVWFMDGEQKVFRTRWSKHFKDRMEMYKVLWYLHSEGVPYRSVAKAFSGQPTKYMRNLEPVPHYLIQSRSVFWAHDHISRILDLFWKWLKTEKGISRPR